jgi:hypothetical protein
MATAAARTQGSRARARSTAARLTLISPQGAVVRNRRTVVVVLVVVLVYLGFTVTYLTRFTIGDPFSGTWRLNPADPYAVVIKLTKGGYFIAVANGQTSSGWVAARRSGSVLTGTVRVLDTLVFQSWDGHLVETDHDLNMFLTKTSGSTSITPRRTGSLNRAG